MCGIDLGSLWESSRDLCVHTDPRTQLPCACVGAVAEALLPLVYGTTGYRAFVPQNV